MLKVMIKCQEGEMKQPQRMHYKKKQLQFLTTCSSGFCTSEELQVITQHTQH